jgi:lipoate-protein ligase A
MKTVITKSLDPKYNLALEEHLLINRKEEFCLLWQSNNSVIIGKNQNTVDEINTEYVEDNKIIVVRRITGGGAVYHDLGNINFSYIVNTYDKNNTFSKFTSSVIEALESYGIPAEFSGKNDILVNGMKISGNAQAIRDNRILHHGTLLFDSDLTKFGKILKPKTDKLESNGVSSIESRVTNILPYFKEGDVSTIAEFKDKLLKKLLQIRDEDSIMPVNIYELSENDKSAIDYLIKNKYSTDAWNYNNIEVSEFNVNKYCRYEGGGGITFRLKIVDEQIENIKIFGDFLGYGDISDIEDSLKNITFQYSVVKKKLQKFDLKKYFGNITLDNILHCLFNNKSNNSKIDFVVCVNLLSTVMTTVSNSSNNNLECNTACKNRSIRIKNLYKSVNNESFSTLMTLSETTDRDVVDGYWIKKNNNEAMIGFQNESINGDLFNDSIILTVDINDNINIGMSIGSIETTKIVSDIISPLTGTLIDINSTVINNPTILENNQAENESNWIYKLKI